MAGQQQTLQTDQEVVPSTLVFIRIYSSTVIFMYKDFIFNVSTDIGVTSEVGLGYIQPELPSRFLQCKIQGWRINRHEKILDCKGEPDLQPKTRQRSRRFQKLF